ncbi:MAG: FliI/YscN family ATPase [Phycisphaerales bacterium]|nr:FliI/YscN family ATPase [Phycisphaerales bacterium]
MTLLDNYISQIDTIEPKAIRGQVESVRGLTLRVVDLPAPVDSAVDIITEHGTVIAGQVVGFEQQFAMVMALGSLTGIARGNPVHARSNTQRIACSPLMVGRVIDAMGHPMDAKGPIKLPEFRSINVRSVDCMQRVPINHPIGTGIRAVDALHTCGLGQRMGIFAGPGVGKSTLMSMIAKNTSADISIIALIGERGREVQDFLQHSLGQEGLKRAIVIVSTSDDPPVLRVRGARVACTIAEYFRDEGMNVLLLMDSLTRMAQAQRQIGLSVGEPPATKGYTPSVFALLPEILERAGKTSTGSVTGFYTVLVEGDDFNEPIADAVKGLTDGHLWLDRHLANRGHFPAIGILQSISRVRPDVTDPEQQKMARRINQLLAAYADIEDLVNIGAFMPGANPLNDLAVRTYAKIMEFLQQSTETPTTLAQAKVQLIDLYNAIEKEAKLIDHHGRHAPQQPAATAAKKK